MDELRVALVKSWRAPDFQYSVYGVLDAEELALNGWATLTLGSGQVCTIQADDVMVLPDIDIQELGSCRFDS